ncbi:hypothetical protein KOW79_022077 [Hemibagrus wyckioides]|uniref:Uncharacterized protein n=1 Tax=Hemibagrus wyckioides TaxID=337641 RepID=A0A9D3N4P4_9TELE|nr:hypothetical protein KOW79_022077 [Hemibagrus wyckioides]
MKKANDVGEILNVLDFSRVRNDVVGMDFSDLQEGDAVMQKGMDHYDGSDVKVNEEILNENYHHFLSIKNSDDGMDFGDLHHYGFVDVKINLVVLNVEYSFLGMRVFGQHDGDGTVEKMVHGGEILNGDNGRFQNRENVYVRMGCDHHHDGGYEILYEDDFLNVEHHDVCFGGGDVMEKVNDGDENDDYQYAMNDLGFSGIWDNSGPLVVSLHFFFIDKYFFILADLLTWPSSFNKGTVSSPSSSNALLRLEISVQDWECCGRRTPFLNLLFLERLLSEDQEDELDEDDENEEELKEDEDEELEDEEEEVAEDEEDNEPEEEEHEDDVDDEQEEEPTDDIDAFDESVDVLLWDFLLLLWCFLCCLWWC